MKQGYIKILRSCKCLIAELNGYVWNDKSAEDAPLKENDHACVTGDTIVQTENGGVPISELVGKTGKVWTYNTKTKKKELKRFSNVALTKKKAQIYRVVFEDGRIVRCTGDHPILTTSGYKQAKDLKAEDEVISVM